MGRSISDEAGKVYGQLKVLKLAFVGDYKHTSEKGAYWECLCKVCKQITIIRGDCLRQGNAVRCQKCANIQKGIDSRIGTLTEDPEIITGLILGDGSLVRTSKQAARLAIGQINRGLTYFLRNKLCPKVNVNRYPKPNGTTAYCCGVTSEKLVPYHETWYPGNKKQIPTSLELTPKTTLHWFMGDGSTAWITGRDRRSVNLVISSESFTREENFFLAELLGREINASVNVSTNGQDKNGNKYYRLHLAKRDYVKAFLDYIGPCPVPEMAYKWKYPII